MPRRFPVAHGQMKHICPVVTSVPMSRSRVTPDDITDVQSPRLCAFVTNPSRPGQNFEQLSIFVSVPVRSGTRLEHNMAHGDAIALEDRVHPDVARESRGGFGAGLFRVARAANYG